MSLANSRSGSLSKHTPPGLFGGLAGIGELLTRNARHGRNRMGVIFDWDKSLVQFINTRGQDKVLFGTDWPIIEFERAMREIEELDLREAAKQKLLVDNAV